MRGLTLMIFTILMAMRGEIASADHTSPTGSVSRLVYESQELVQTVRYVGLNYNVQQSVDRFNYDVLRLSDCIRFYGNRGLVGESSLTSGDHLEAPDMRDHTENPGVPSQCRMNLDVARRSFAQVERYLYDTNYDYPQVYRSYLETREALYSLQSVVFPGPGPGTQPGQVTCTAVDSGWEEHGGGHLGYGYNLMQAQRMAIGQCQRFHGRCRIQQCR